MSTLATVRPERKTGADAARLYSVQALRAVAALLVVWAHSIDAAEQSHARPVQIGFFHWENFGACGLDIFFVISGFIVSLVAARAATKNAEEWGSGRNWRSAKTFLIRRATRIFPLYWILTLVLILQSELSRYKIAWHTVPWLPTLLLLPAGKVPVQPPLLSIGWSLIFEFYFYYVLAVFLFFTPRALMRNTLVFLSAMAGIGFILGIQRPFLVLWMNPMILEFVFGCWVGWLYLRRGKRTDERSHFGMWIGLFGAGLLAATIFTGYGNASEEDIILSGYACWLRVGVWGIPAALLVGGMVFWSPALRSLPARLLVFLGDASYSIYLCTAVVRSVVVHFWHNVFGHFGADIGVLLGGVFCTCVGILCYLCIERPLMRITHNWQKPVPFHVSASEK